MNTRPILLDVSRLIWRAWSGRMPTGIDRTCLAYVAHYAPRARAVIQRGGATHIASPALSQALFDLLLEGAPLHFRRRFLALVVRHISSLWARPHVTDHVYLNVGHTGLNLPGHAAWLRTSGVRPLYFVHDLIPITHPEYCRPGEGERHERRIRALLNAAKGVIGNSRETIDALAAYARSQHLPEPPGVVAPLGIPELPHDNSVEPPLGRPYFVMLGTIEGRKNHLTILTAWAELARQYGRNTPQLVIIGQRGWECEQAVDMLDRCEALRGHVIELPRCDDALLARYLHHARALLFPSFAEGYGLPLVEALGVGTPVIASNLPVFRELAGDIPDYLSPIDGVGWSAAVMDYARPDSAARAAQLHRLRGYSAPGWTEHFAIVDPWMGVFADF